MSGRAGQVFSFMKIAAAAVRIGKKIYIGSTHFEASRKFIDLPEMLNAKTEDGYVTDTGQFVDREEAFKIAVANGQMQGEFADPKYNTTFFGTNRPRLESSLLENYAAFCAEYNFI